MAIEEEVEDFLEQHSRIRAIVVRRGEGGRCSTMEDIMTEAKVTDEEMKWHLELFLQHKCMSEVLKGLYCDRTALEKLVMM